MESIVLNTRSKKNMYEMLKEIDKASLELVKKYDNFTYASEANEENLTITIVMKKTL